MASYGVPHMPGLWEPAKLCRRAAERGHPVAQFYLGIMCARYSLLLMFVLCFGNTESLALLTDSRYRDGKGLNKNHKEAKKWLGLAAEQGDTLALYALGRFVLEEEPETDWLTALDLFKQAAEQVYPRQ